MARLPFWQLQGVQNLQNCPLHARIYYDPTLSNKDYIRDAINPRSSAIDLGGPRGWSFNDPSGNGSGPGYQLHFPGNPTSFLFPNYNTAQAGGHTVAVYNPSNQVIIASRALGAWTLESRVNSYARILHLDPFFVMQEVGGADQHSYWCLRMFWEGSINWATMPAVIALLDETYAITRSAVKYTNNIANIPFSAIIKEAYVPGKFVNQAGIGLSSPTKIDGVPAGRQVKGYACYNQATGEILRLQSFHGGGITTSGTEPVWVTDMRLVIGQ